MKRIFTNRAICFFFTLYLLIAPDLGFAQFSGGGVPASIIHNLPIDHLPRLTFALSVEETLMAQLPEISKPGTPLRAGFILKAGITPHEQAYTEIVQNHTQIWRLRIHSPAAQGIGLHLEAFEMHPDARLYFYTPDRSVILGYFSHYNNNADKVFSTGIVPGDEIIIEYQQPFNPSLPQSFGQPPFRLESVAHISNGQALVPTTATKQLGTAGFCNVNINCPEGTAWQDEKRGIALMLMRIGNGVFYCTGTLVNNTQQNADPLFLTAAHCIEGATARDKLFWHFYFNFEHTGCNNTGVPLHHLLVGANLLATGPLRGGSDFSLMRLRQNPPAHWQLYWNGWDRSGSIAPSGVGIHHPGGDAKKISTFTTSVSTVTPTIEGDRMATNSAWALRWSQTQSGHGITEGGSSGSPLFNAAGLIIGTLVGGASSCDHLLGSDYYGRLFHHWDQNGVLPSQRLAPHLDPLATGVSQLQGLDPHVEKFPPPGHITAGLQQNQQAAIRWWPPGSFPNPPGWFGYRNTAHYITMSTPERAVFFEAPGLGLSYPIILEAIRHRFFEIPTRLWTSDRFEFLVYDSDGTAILHRSPIITASKTDWTQYIFPQPLQINRPFYVAVRPIGAGGFPSSGGMQVNYGQSFSFAGTSGRWEQPGYFEDRSGALCYLTGIRVGGTIPANVVNEQMLTENAFSSTGMHTKSASSHPDLEVLSAATPEGYRLYRNNVLIHSTGVSGPLSFTDTSVPVGLTEYRATATYANNVESTLSATAFLLRPDPCAVIIASFPYLQDFPSGFSSQCWIQSGANPWQLSASRIVGSTTVHPAQGAQFFHHHTTSASQPNQWLILPEVNMTTLAHPAIRFRFTGIYRANGPRLRVWASISGSQFTLIWDSHMHPVFSAGASNLQWLSATLNARELANRNSVRIAFQVTGAGEGFFGLDVIEVLSAAPITHSLTLSATPEFSGMVSGQGSFLAGQAVTVHATPNAGGQFAGWLRGTTLQSAQATYSFVMPSSNLALTARFETITTTVPVIEQHNQGFEVFPNPAKDFVHIRFLEPEPEALLTLLDPQGRVIKQQALGTVSSGHIEQISLVGVRSGVYLLKVETNRGVRVSRLVLSK